MGKKEDVILIVKRKIIPYHPSLVPLARKLRQSMTIAEAMLWKELKQKKMLGMDFDRQRPILTYIVDFYCKDLMLAIEIDGGSHDSKQNADSKRQKEVESAGIHFLRFQEQEVRHHIVKVLYAIQNWMEEEINNNGLQGRSAE